MKALALCHAPATRIAVARQKRTSLCLIIGGTSTARQRLKPVALGEKRSVNSVC